MTGEGAGPWGSVPPLAPRAGGCSGCALSEPPADGPALGAMSTALVSATSLRVIGNIHQCRSPYGKSKRPSQAACVPAVFMRARSCRGSRVLGSHLDPYAARASTRVGAVSTRPSAAPGDQCPRSHHLRRSARQNRVALFWASSCRSVKSLSFPTRPAVHSEHGLPASCRCRL